MYVLSRPSTRPGRGLLRSGDILVVVCYVGTDVFYNNYTTTTAIYSYCGTQERKTKYVGFCRAFSIVFFFLGLTSSVIFHHCRDMFRKKNEVEGNKRVLGGGGEGGKARPFRSPLLAH